MLVFLINQIPYRNGEKYLNKLKNIRRSSTNYPLISSIFLDQISTFGLPLVKKENGSEEVVVIYPALKYLHRLIGGEQKVGLNSINHYIDMEI